MCNIVPNLRISGGAADQHADSCAGDDSPEVLRRSVSDMLSDPVLDSISSGAEGDELPPPPFQMLTTTSILEPNVGAGRRFWIKISVSSF